MTHLNLTPLMAAIAALTIATGTAPAQTIITVNDATDIADPVADGICDVDLAAPGNQCTLRAAIQNANLIGGHVIINIPLDCALSLVGADNLALTGDLDIFDPGLTLLELRGAAPGLIFIDATPLSTAGSPERVFDIRATLPAATIVEMSDLVILGGDAATAPEDSGGGIQHLSGDLALTNVQVSNNQCSNDGGAIHAASPGRLTLTDCTLEGNDAASVGGAVYISSAAFMTATNTRFDFNAAANRGGAIRVASGAAAALFDCLLNTNAANVAGGIANRGDVMIFGGSITGSTTFGGVAGAIGNELNATMLLDGVTIRGNTGQAGGGINNAAMLQMFRCTVDDNAADTGAGILNTITGNLRLEDSTISRNTASDPMGFGGAGIRSIGQLEVNNSTISENESTTGMGAGIYWEGGFNTAEINLTTIANNRGVGGGGGIFTDGSFGVTTIAFSSVLVADNTINGGIPNNFIGNFPVTSAGFNLDTDGSLGLAGPGDQSNVPANLGPLQNNGGPTQTHELLLGSFAINAGTCTSINGTVFAADQRALPRDPSCDVGAFERQGITPPNDDCPNADPLLIGVTTFDNTLATTDGPAEPCLFTGIQNLDHDLWYEFTLQCDADWFITLHPAPFDRGLSVYSGCPQLGGVLLACDVAVAGGAVTIPGAGVAGEVFHVRVGGAPGQTGIGDIELDIQSTCIGDCAPPGGNCVINFDDLIATVNDIGCVGICACDHAPAPFGNGIVNFDDLVAVINNFGPCP